VVSRLSTIFKSRRFCRYPAIGIPKEHTPEDADKTVWKIAYDKPLIVSEFGGDAKYGLHGDSDRRWTEEYQADLYRHQLLML
jgi:beta-glucuronidase